MVDSEYELIVSSLIELARNARCWHDVIGVAEAVENARSLYIEVSEKQYRDSEEVSKTIRAAVATSWDRP